MPSSSQCTSSITTTARGLVATGEQLDHGRLQTLDSVGRVERLDVVRGSAPSADHVGQQGQPCGELRTRWCDEGGQPGSARHIVGVGVDAGNVPDQAPERQIRERPTREARRE